MNLNITDKKILRTGIFGGSFNPIHKSHLALCTYARIALKLDKIILIPTGDNPFKDEGKISRYDRFNMTKLAVENMRGYEVSDIEINRPGESYTVDTLNELEKHENEVFYFISGSDILMQLSGWMHFDELAKLTNFAVVQRREVDNTRYLQEAERLNNVYGAKIYLLEDYTPKEISSTKIRNGLQDGSDIKDMLPTKVYEYIKAKGLYV